MFRGICAATWAPYAADGVALVVILVFAIVAAKKGFVECFFGFISTVLAIIVAFLFMNALMSATNGLFGLQGVLQNSLIGAFGKIKGFETDISASGLEAALADKNLPQFVIDIIMKNVTVADVPAGTTLAMVVGETVGTIAATFIAWLAIFLGAKLVLKLVEKIFTSIVENVPLIGSLNSLLGFVVGALQGLLIVSGVIAVLALIPSEGITTFFNECAFVGYLYNQNPINTILAWISI